MKTPASSSPTTARRFPGKAAARTAVWDALTRKRAAHPMFEKVKVIKVNPDSPQRWVRKLALERGITVITPTPRLEGAFRRLDPAKIPPERYDDAATLKRGGRWGEDLALDELPRIDLVVMGSVAVTRGGRRLGKGHGYADLEYAMPRELGNPAVPVATTVHALQILGDFPTESHDLPVSLIATPEELIEVNEPVTRPTGIQWDRLAARALEEMPVLAELKRLLAKGSKAKRRRKAKP